MATFTANIRLKFTFRLQSQTFSAPRMKKVIIGFSKGREFGSSGPVRYIPKRLLKSEDPVSYPPWSGSRNTDFDECSNGNALRIEAAKNGRGAQKSVVSDGKSEFRNQMLVTNSMPGDGGDEEACMDLDDDDDDETSLEVMEEPSEVDEELKVNETSDCYGHNVVQASFMKEAQNVAVELLSIRAYAVAELRKKLLKKGFGAAIVNAVINDLHRRGLINDGLYAETFSHSRWSTSTWGPRRIKQALCKKGVGKVAVEKAVQLVFRDDGSEDQDLKLGLSKVSMDHLYVQASKQWIRGRDVPRETRKGRIVRWLQYRGFDWGVTSVILKRLESQYPT